MPTIARMYRSQETATTVVKELRDKGFSEESTHLFAQSSPQPAGGGTSQIAEAISQAGIAPAAAKIYAEGVGRGEALVVADPLFGFGRAATDIMDSHDPIAVDVPEPAAPHRALRASTSKASASTDWSGAAPLSAVLGLPVLSSDAAPLSRWFGWTTIKHDPRTSNTLEGIRKQSQDAAPFSTKLGLATLSSNAAPVSGLFGWKLLSDKPAPLSAKFGWRVLSDKPAPLSEKLGWRVLLSDPTPLSTALKWKTLSKGLTTVSDS